jgi:hypothetical protein
MLKSARFTARSWFASPLRKKKLRNVVGAHRVAGDVGDAGGGERGGVAGVAEARVGQAGESVSRDVCCRSCTPG